MESDNPYMTPDSDLNLDPHGAGMDEKTFNHLAKGQKLIVGALLFGFLSNIPLLFLTGESLVWLTIILQIIWVAMILTGLIRILIGSSIKWYWKLILFIGLPLPLVNILIIMHRATKELRAGGYKVGLIGVKGSYAG